MILGYCGDSLHYLYTMSSGLDDIVSTFLSEVDATRLMPSLYPSVRIVTITLERAGSVRCCGVYGNLITSPRQVFARSGDDGGEQDECC